MNVEKFYESLLSHSYDAVAILGSKGVIRYISPSVQRFLGFEAASLIGKNLFHLIAPEDIKHLQHIFYTILELQEPYAEGLLHIQDQTGQTKYILFKALNQLEHPMLSGIVCNIADITGEKEMYQELQEYNLFKAIFDSSGDATLVLDHNLEVSFFNRKAKNFIPQIAGVEVQVQMSVAEFCHDPDMFVQWHETFAKVFAGEMLKQEYAFSLPELSEPLWQELTFTPLYNKKKQIFALAMRFSDIQKRKQAEQQLLHTQKYLKAVFDSSHEIIFIIDKQLHISWLNQAAIKMIQELFDKKAQIGDPLLPYTQLSEEQIPKLVADIEKAFEGQTHRIERRFNTLQEEQRWYEITYQPLRDEQEDIFAICLGIFDITARRENEKKLKALNYQLVAQNKELARQESQMKSTNSKLLEQQAHLNIAFQELSDRNFELDQLVYKTSHDLRSPLTSILGLVNLMKIEGVPEHLQEYVGRIESSIHRLDHFVSSMLNHAKVSRQEIASEPVALKALLYQCLENFAYSENYQKVKVRIQEEGEANFRSDMLRLSIIFNNIISNAFKYANVEQEESFLHIFIQYFPQYVLLRFQDNGLGIEADYLERVFEMFFRANEKAADGSGLGLYIVKQSVEKLGGSIEIESEVLQGTCITLRLPVV
jgi:PAS domain S-box-containing protein